MRILQTFEALAAEGKKAVIPYITAGYPDWQTTGRLLKRLSQAGATIVELGIPFSDPVADGPVIQKASEIALSKGINLKLILEGLKKEPSPLPVVAMGYYNPILRYGIERFAREAAEAGIGGLIVPDLPPEEAGELREAAEMHGIATTFLIAPTTPRERIATIAEATTGFLYLVSVKGVTGSDLGEITPILERIEEIRGVTSLPVCVGFGVSKPEDARAISRYADGVIVGSAVLKALDEGGEEGLIRFVREIAQAVNGDG